MFSCVQLVAGQRRATIMNSLKICLHHHKDYRYGNFAFLNDEVCDCCWVWPIKPIGHPNTDKGARCLIDDEEELRKVSLLLRDY